MNQFVGTDSPRMRKRTYAASSGNLMSTHVQIEMMPLSPTRISGTRIQMTTVETTVTTATTTNRLADLASFDSSDTWPSSNPFPSITDLSSSGGGGEGGGCEIDQQQEQQHRYQNIPESNPSHPYYEGKELGEEQEQEENSTLLYQGNNAFSASTASTTVVAEENKTEMSRPRPRFKGAFSSEEELMTPSPVRREMAQGRVNKKLRKAASTSTSSSSTKSSFLSGRGIASATRFLNYRFLSLNSAENQYKSPTDRSKKKSILKRSNNEGTSSASSSSAAAGAEIDGDDDGHDQETENLIGCTKSESGSEPFSPLMAQRVQHSRSNEDSSTSTAVEQHQTSQHATVTDWPYADDDDSSTGDGGSKIPTAS